MYKNDVTWLGSVLFRREVFLGAKVRSQCVSQYVEVPGPIVYAI